MIKAKINWDAFGICASLACAVHCAVLPLVLTSFSLFGMNIIHNEFFEIFMILLALCIGIFSLRHGRKHHGQILPTFIFIAGIIFLFIKEVIPSKELFFLIPAVILIVSAHCCNFIFNKKILMKKKLSKSED